MPNHVSTILRAAPEVIKALLDEKDEIDFNLIIPMPEEVKGTTVGSPGLDMMDPNGWYGWSVSHWGTKWNAYSTQPVTGTDGDLAEVRFDTAWSHPDPVINALSKKFPDQVIYVDFADEDLGSNQGQYLIQDGSLIDSSVPDGTPEALEHAAQVKYGRAYAELRAEWDAEDAEYEARYNAQKELES